MTNKVLLTKFWLFCIDMQNMTALSFLDGFLAEIGVQFEISLIFIAHILYWFSHAVEGNSDDEDGFGLGRCAYIASLQFKAYFNFQLSLGSGLGGHFYCMQ